VSQYKSWKLKINFLGFMGVYDARGCCGAELTLIALLAFNPHKFPMKILIHSCFGFRDKTSLSLLVVLFATLE
jgi:hypothetical protein